MKYEIGRLVKDVRVAIDRNRVNTDMIAVDMNTQLLDENIIHNIVDGVRMVLVACRASMLDEPSNFATEDIEWMDHCAGRVKLPSDFIRFVGFQMDDWAYPAIVAEDETSAAYPMMKSPIKALRGVAERPRVFIISSGADKYLEFYSCNSENAKVKEANYIALPKIEDEAIDVPFLCYTACVNQIAALCIMERGGTELAQVLQQEVAQIIS